MEITNVRRLHAVRHLFKTSKSLVSRSHLEVIVIRNLTQFLIQTREDQKKFSTMDVNVYPNESSPKLFDNKLEGLTRSSILTVDIMYAIIIVALTSVYIFVLDHTVARMLIYFVSAFFSWTLAEYLMHRFLYHDIKDANYNNGIHYLFHGIHHEFPNDDGRIVLPPVPSILIASIFFGIFYLIFRDDAFAFAPGFILGYLVYINIHWMVHKYPSPNRFNFWWRHHNIHHFQQHDKAFGVSTPIWDYVFRTMPIPNRKTINIRMRSSEETAENEVPAK